MKTKRIDHEGTSNVVCPHCGHEHSDSWEISDGEHECRECERPFDVSSWTDRVISTHKVYRCDACNSACSKRANGTTHAHWVYGTTGNCPGGKAVER